MTALEARRLHRLLRHGVATDGEVIGEELDGIRNRAPYPVVRFQLPDGTIKQFRSSISKKSQAFVHRKKVTVRYVAGSPETAELFSGIHPYKHLIGGGVVLALSIACAAFGLPMLLAS
ncbi:MAG: hypothetical protein HZA93_16920 [Verrucomicrobia bacterium]|nr:hypothetical protein [Verrucomicrobiota bacterium]